MIPSSPRSRTRRRMMFAGLALAMSAPARQALGATRVITVGGAVTEIVYALHMDSVLVATDTTSIYPDAANRLPKIGYQRALSAEGVLALRPGMVVAAGEAGPAAAIEQLRAARVAVHQLPIDHSAQGVTRTIARVAELLGRPDRGRTLSDEFSREWEKSAEDVARHTERPRVVFVLAHSPNNTMVAGTQTAADAMIRLAGGINAMGTFAGYRPLTAEGAVAAHADVLLTSTQALTAAGEAAAFWRKPGLAHTPAGRAGRLAHLDALYLLGFGPRLPAAVRDLARAIRAGAKSA